MSSTRQNKKSNKQIDIEAKIKTLDELAAAIKDLKKKGKVVVHCHGVFDLLHPGHIRHLNQAKARGDVLVVTVTRDEFVNKGPGRPVFNQFLRAESLAALGCIDYVAINEWPTAVETIKKLQPNFYVKGSDYSKRESDLTGKIYEEEEAVKAVGGDICFTNDISFSSTSILNMHFNIFTHEAKQFIHDFRKRHSAEVVVNDLRSLSDLKVLIVGDAIIDEYHYCSGIGKPQKENIIAVRYLSDEIFAGGSLAIANHVAGFCKDVELVTLLGQKNDYTSFINSRLKPNVKRKFFVKKDISTVVKRRFLDPSFLAKMFEMYFIDDFLLDSALERQMVNYLDKTLPKYDVVIAADFGHGLITNKIIKTLCEKARFLVVNTQTNSANTGFNLITKYPRADYICIDEPELRLALQDKFTDTERLALKLAELIKSKKITITRGHRGSLVYSKKKGFASVPVFSKEVVDRVGAGDAYLSITALAVARDFPNEEIGFIGNAVGALAVLIVGNRNSVEPLPLFRFINTLLK
jgi:rfaE bifunctional protein nucleotidyltransferase chain/domain